MSRRVTLRRATALLVVCTLPALGACTSRHRQVTWLSPETYPEREALEFRRASPSAPWRVELRARLINNTPPPAIAADRGGRASTVDARLTKKLRFSGKQVETLSSYYTTAYRLGDGGGLMLVSLEGTRRMYAKEPTLVALQQDASREGLGGLVPPGQYSSLIFQTTTMLAVEVPPAESRRPLRVVGWREIDLSVDATPA